MDVTNFRPIYCRNNDRLDNDDDKYRRSFLTAENLLRESNRYLSGDELCVRVRSAARICCRELYLLGQEGEEEKQENQSGRQEGFKFVDCSLTAAIVLTAVELFR